MEPDEIEYDDNGPEGLSFEQFCEYIAAREHSYPQE
ncbi:MAG: hypothetical protein JWR85_4225 [Marmoricola sp.]|nr:hypothetical protein [Marmoricola sp.]